MISLQWNFRCHKWSRGQIFKGRFHQPVFQGVEGNDSAAAMQVQQTARFAQAPFQGIQFVIDFNPQRLECLLGGMALLVQFFFRKCTADDIHQLEGCINRAFLPAMLNRTGNLYGIPFLAILAQNTDKILVWICVDNLPCIFGLFLVHPHIQPCIIAIAESTLGIIELR